jgi:hypothetical protein
MGQERIWSVLVRVYNRLFQLDHGRMAVWISSSAGKCLFLFMEDPISLFFFY